MTDTPSDRRNYFPQGQFSLDETFITNPLMAAVTLARYKFVAKMLSPNDVVLDLGCGNGYASHFFSKHAREVVGVDLYADVPAAKARFGSANLNFIRADILQPSSEVTSLRPTVVTSIDVIEHFYREDGEQIIDRYASMLPRGGMMIMGTPSKFSQQYRSQQAKDVHFHEYEPDELREVMAGHFNRTLLFSMNDELVHTGFTKLAWFFFVLGFK